MDFGRRAISHAAVVLVATCALAGSGASAAEIPADETRCYAVDTSDVRATCGQLSVPENYAHPNGPRVVNSYVRLRSRTADPSLAPVLYIEGGPGGGTLGAREFYYEFWSSWAARLDIGRDIILFDQRGSGSSSPNLNCPELDDLAVRAGLSKDRNQFDDPWHAANEALKSCRDRLIGNGVDLEQYNSANIVRDIEHLRRQLGVKKIVLMGVSNGTRIALNYLREHEDAVEMLVLDSAAPPDALLSQDFVFGLSDFIDQLAEKCLTETSCNAAHSDIRKKFAFAVKRLAKDPVIIDIGTHNFGTPLYARVDDALFTDILLDMSYNASDHSKIVQFISDVSENNTLSLPSRVQSMFVRGVYNSHLYEAAYWSINCSDEYDPATGPDYLKQLEKYPLLQKWGAGYWNSTACAFWPMTLAAPRDRSPVTSSVPTLIVGGKFDPVTTPSYARRVAKTLENSKVVILPTPGHTVMFTNDCAMRIIRKFAKNPTGTSEDECVSKVKPPKFDISILSMFQSAE